MYVGKASSKSFIERIPSHLDFRIASWFNKLLVTIHKNEHLNSAWSDEVAILLSRKAFEELKAGKAYIASISGESQNIVIRRIYLAYYDPGEATDFYQPIIVFEGDNNFVAYLPAVSADYYVGDSTDTAQ